MLCADRSTRQSWRSSQVSCSRSSVRRTRLQSRRNGELCTLRSIWACPPPLCTERVRLWPRPLQDCGAGTCTTRQGGDRGGAWTAAKGQYQRGPGYGCMGFRHSCAAIHNFPWCIYSYMQLSISIDYTHIINYDAIMLMQSSCKDYEMRLVKLQSQLKERSSMVRLCTPQWLNGDLISIVFLYRRSIHWESKERYVYSTLMPTSGGRVSHFHPLPYSSGVRRHLEAAAGGLSSPSFVWTSSGYVWWCIAAWVVGGLSELISSPMIKSMLHKVSISS